MLGKNVETFLTVAEHGSFARAADSLYVSRAALIQQVNLLEEKMGFSLFFRSNKGVTLTRSGHVYYDEVSKMAKRYQSILNTCRSIQNIDVVSIGLLPNFPSTVLPYICSLYHERYPGRRLRFVEYPMDEYFKAFGSGAFDVTAEYVCDLYNSVPQFASLEIMRTVHCIGVPHGHPLAGAPQITPDMLNGHAVLMYRRGISRPDDLLRNYLEEHAPLSTILDFDSYTSYLDSFCNAYGHLLIYYDAYETSFPGLIKKPLKIDEDIRVQLGIGYREEHTPYVQDFLDIVSEMFLSSPPADQQ